MLKKCLDHLKNFYAHLVICVITGFLLFVGRGRNIDFLVGKGARGLNWMEWNMILIPVIWGVVLMVRGVYFLKLEPGFFRKWEERQMRKYMEE